MRDQKSHPNEDGPRQAWANGNIDLARRLTKDRLQHLIAHPGHAQVRADSGALEHLQLLLHLGLIDQAESFMRTLHDVPTELSLPFYLLDKVVQCCRIPFRISQVDVRDEAVFAVLPVWGDTYLDLWEHGGLVAFANDAAMPLYENRNFEFHVYTRPRDLSRLRAMAGMDKLTEHTTVRYFNLELILGAHRRRGLDAMNIAHWTTFTLSKCHNAHMLFLFADMIYSGRSLTNLSQKIRDDRYDLLLMLDPQLGKRGWANIKRQTNEKSGFSTELMIAAFLQDPSTRDLGWRIDPDEKVVPARPIRINRITETTAELRTVLPQPLFISNCLSHRMAIPSPTGFDLFVVEAALATLNGSERMGLLVDPEEFFCMSVVPDRSSPEPRIPTSNDVIEDALINLSNMGLLGSGRHWAFQNPLLIGKTAKDKTLETIANRFLEKQTFESNTISEYAKYALDVLAPTYAALYAKEVSIKT